ncbi:MAG: (d)CMP kinase [Bacilli bacterium]|nr:(d)CMP kinase [Bacilli bacterium]
MKKFFNLAIDGPAGAGKSTIAKEVAKRLGFIYVDTGAMYRAVGLYYINKKIDVTNEEEVNKEIDNINVEFKILDDGIKLFLNGEDVTDKIRTPEVSDAASKVSVHKLVRERMVAMQQEIAKKNNIVMDGRDIGTVVLPNADLKIYLTASVEERANRRFKEYIDKGEEADLEQIKKDIEERDYRDMHRDISPLREAEDAIHLDSTGMMIEEEISYILDFVNNIRNEE